MCIRDSLGIATVIVNAVMLYGSGTKSKQYEDWLFAEFKDDSYGSTENQKS